MCNYLDADAGPSHAHNMLVLKAKRDSLRQCGLCLNYKYSWLILKLWCCIPLLDSTLPIACSIQSNQFAVQWRWRILKSKISCGVGREAQSEYNQKQNHIVPSLYCSIIKPCYVGHNPWVNRHLSNETPLLLLFLKLKNLRVAVAGAARGYTHEVG